MFILVEPGSHVQQKSKKDELGKNPPLNLVHREYVNVSRKILAKDIVGPKFRSKTGCLRCRQRRKKCDETHPVCKACKRRNENCVWSSEKIKSVQRRKQKDEDKSQASIVSIEGAESDFGQNDVFQVLDENSSYTDSSDKSRYTNKTGHQVLNDLGRKNDDTNKRIICFQKAESSSIGIPEGKTLEASSFREDKIVELDDFNSNLEAMVKTYDDGDKFQRAQNEEYFFSKIFDYRQPSSAPSLYLDERGIVFFNYFKENVSSVISIGLENSNYLLKTFISMSMSDESILKAIASWGGLFLCGTFENSKAESYMSDAVSILKKKFKNNPNLNKCDVITLLCFNLISIGIYVCSGDVKKWIRCFHDCKLLLMKYGGIIKLCNDFEYNNDIRFLLSNFQYHDIMSSLSFLEGTKIPIKEYEVVFDDADLFFPTNYGVDPLQGCNQSLYLVLGEIVNTKVFVNKYRNEIEEKMYLQLHEALTETVEEIALLRNAFLEYVNSEAQKLEAKINSCQPYYSQHFRIVENDLEQKLHQTSFQVYKNVCNLYLKMYVKGMPPKTYEIQQLLLQSLKMIDELIDSKMIVIVCLPLLTVAMAAYTEIDKKVIEGMFEKVLERCPVGNVRKARIIVEESWKRNFQGDFSVDWAEICEEFGWELCVC